jgi:hypothetical protein
MNLIYKFPRFGPQIRDFRSVLQTYRGEISILKLKDNPALKRSGETARSHSSIRDSILINAKQED